MARGLQLSALVGFLLLIAQGDCQCLQNFDFPSGGFNQQHAAFYNISTCLRCTQNAFSSLVVGSGVSPEALSNLTSGVTILPPPSGTNHYILVIPFPRDVFSDTADTIIRCRISTSPLVEEDIQFSELVFNDPVLNPSGSIDVIEGSSDSLSCASSTTAMSGITSRWTFGSSELVTSTSNVIYSYNDIMRNRTGDYNCTVTLSVGSGFSAPRYVVSRSAVVSVNVQYPPEVTLDTAQITRKMGESLTLQCMIDGNPTPIITWWFNGTMLDTAPSRFTTNVAGNMATLTIMPLAGNDTGTYQCSGNNSIGSASTSGMVPITVQVPPDPVNNLQPGQVTDTSIAFSWSLPGFDGRESIDNVTVSYNAVSNNVGASMDSALLQPETTTHVFMGLQPFTNYSISVVATNNVGDSAPVMITVETLPVVPGSPTIVMVSAVSSTELSVTWMTPMRNTFTQTAFEMSRIEYSLSSDFSNAQTASVPASVTTFDTPNPLMKGTDYYFRVSVNNSAGFGPMSAPASGRTAVDPPTQVQGLTLTSYPNSICVTWSPPSDNGGQGINRYSVQWASVTFGDDGSTPSNTTSDPIIGESSSATVTPPSITHLIMSLASTTTYIVNVSAGNMEGGLGMAIQMNTTTGSAIPVHPTVRLTYSELTAISVQLAWNAPASTSYMYIVEYRTSAQPSWSDARRLQPSTNTMSNLQGLDSDIEYTLRVIILDNCTQQVTPEVVLRTRPLRVNVTGSQDGGINVPVGVDSVTLQCRLDTGQEAPNVTWSREEGPLPTNIQINQSTLIILNPQPEDSGNYTCTSRGMVSSTVPLVVMNLVSQGLALWIIIVIAVAAALSFLLFLIVLILIICFACRRNKEAKGPAYHMQLQKKTSSSGGWIDEGAGGFVPSTMQSGTYKPTIDDEVDAPIVRGRTHTQDAYTAATFTRKNELSTNNTDV